MSALKSPIHQTAAAIYGLHAARRASEQERPYLGWSELGSPCERYLWLRLRWAGRENFDGRMLRLFDTGHREEARVIEELKALGYTVWDRDENGHQFACESVDGHLRGHCDIVVQGLPEAPKTPHLVDVKTIKAKKFDELLKKGIRELFPQYYAQGQGYMGRFGLERAMFIFVCKDDDTIQCERFEFDAMEFMKLEARAARIIFAAEPPLRISDRADWYGCKLCRFHGICHGTTAPDVSCRTCAHATPTQGGTWTCEKYGEQIPLDAQRAGCPQHRYIPILLERFAEQTGGSDTENWVQYRNKETGASFVNGEQGYSSREIQACADKRCLGDAGVEQMKAEFPGAEVTA